MSKRTRTISLPPKSGVFPVDPGTERPYSAPAQGKSNTCERCGRPLRNIESIQAGMGPVCRGKECASAEARGDDQLEPWSEPGDVVLWREGGDLAGRGGQLLTNCPRTVIHHSPSGFEVGYGGSGPADLGLAIMAWYLPCVDGADRVDCWRGYCSREAWRLHQRFKEDVLARLNVGERPVTIKADAIRAWIREQLEPEEAAHYARFISPNLDTCA